MGTITPEAAAHLARTATARAEREAIVAQAWDAYAAALARSWGDYAAALAAKGETAHDSITTPGRTK